MLMQMKHSLVMTILGADRPGLVSSIAEVVNRHKGNWLESRMARLAGQFAGILRVECPPEEMEALRSALGDFTNQDIRSHGLRHYCVEHQRPIHKCHYLQAVISLPAAGRTIHRLELHKLLFCA